jgi:UV DNA damage endonuclease
MLNRLGFVASVLSKGISTSRTCRLRNATPLRLRELIESNLAALEQVISFLEAERIQLYRLSSGIIPLASHERNTVRWWEQYGEDLARIGSRFRRAGVRVSMHPGQYTVLNSPHERIVNSSIDELVYHARLLHALGTDESSKIVLHIGGLYAGSEQVAMDRFVAVAERLPHAVLRRLVVENDDRLFDADEAVSVARRLGVPVVFDWLHHHANPTERPVDEVLHDVFDTWRPSDGIPKVHLSTQAADAPPGAHAAFIEVEDMLAMLEAMPEKPFDCMLEAKQKDVALLRLREALAARGVVEHALAEAPSPSRRTGRRPRAPR